jgi:aminopeptidase N
MLRLILTGLLLALVCSAVRGSNGNVDPEPGVPRQLAHFRAAHYRDVRYALSIEILPGADLLKGSEEIHVTLTEALPQLVLDWRVATARDGKPQARVWGIEVNARKADDAREVNDHILIPGAYLKKGENVIRLNFESPIAASGSAVTRYLDREDKSEYIYTLFVPSDASTAFPCFDQPDLKARFKLEARVPSDWRVITNTEQTPQVTIQDTSSGGKIIRRFYETEPLSTYLFAFAAGPFQEFRDEASQIPMRLFVRQSKVERARKELQEVFRLNREGLIFLAKYFDYKYPFPKYDMVVLPEFAYGGMEHAGATFLREESILFPSDPTANDFINRAELMFHEAAHQWFGDLVTMRWFDDLWLKEGFATFMAYKAIEAIMPQYDAWKVFYQKTKPSAYLTDVTRGTTPIWQEISNLSAAKSAYGNIVYRKAPSMLRQAEFYLTPPKFQKAVQLLLKEHAFANAEWADLVRSFERTSERKLDVWAAAWVKKRGMPDVRVEWEATERGRIKSFVVRQGDVLGEGGAWPMRVKLLLAYENAQPETLTLDLKGAGAMPVSEVIGRARPLYVFANYEDYGYGRFLLDPQSRSSVILKLGTVKEDFLRALLWGSLWDSVREAELAPTEYINLAVKHVGSELDEVTVQSILNRTSTAFNRYLSKEQMREVAPRLEGLLSERMRGAETVGLRITYFRAFVSVAMTDEARATLKSILRDELKIPGMTLRSRDRFDIMTALLGRNDTDAPQLLEKLGAQDTSDDARRYSFAAAAARASEATKKKYFNAYLNDAKLAESWIEASLNPFNTIHQSELTAAYLEPALKQLPTLKRTRKIFFVNGWLSAFIGGQCNEAALKTVENFLGRESTLDRDLRLKVLEVVDGLERCVRIKRKFQLQGSKAQS